jgi:hypothetical protein
MAAPSRVHAVLGPAQEPCPRSLQPPGVDHLRELAIRIQATAERVAAAPHEVLVLSHVPVAETLVRGVIIYAVGDDALSPDFPARRELDCDLWSSTHGRARRDRDVDHSFPAHPGDETERLQPLQRVLKRLRLCA